ncbi:hypothetical protein Q3A80_26740 [Burkholderia sp. SR8]|uniref:hypothetical protein n=1 Tax=Burkholderia sp. SR8 TaxID=3062277 RepID=UPI0040637526
MHAGGSRCKAVLDYRARVAALYSAVRRATDYLDFSKKLFSLLRYRTEPVPSTMAAAAQVRRAVARAYRTRAFPRAGAAGLATGHGGSRRPHALLA